MNSQVAKLLELQAVDQKIIRLRRKLDDSPRALATAERELNQRQVLLDQKTVAAKDLQVKINIKEDDLREHEARVEKLRLQQYSRGVKNKEYRAISHEVEGEKANSSFLQDEILKMMTGLEEQQAEIDALKSAVEEADQALDARKVEVQVECESLRTELSKLEQERASIAQDADKDLVSRYERVMQGKGDAALAEVADNVCQECYISLTPQMSLSVRTGTEIITCQSCGRLLYCS